MNTDKIYAEQLANEYAPKDTSKVVALRKLDAKAKLPANVFTYTFGIITALVAGVGMCLSMKVIGNGSILKRFIKAQQEFAELPAAQQPEVMSDISGLCMYDMLHYAYEHLEECKLILCCSEGTKFAGLIDEMVEIEVEGTHAYQEVLRKLGRPSPHIDPSLEHILITGMFHTFFELIIHEMPLKDAENYVREMRAFYTAGWMKIMGQ